MGLTEFQAVKEMQDVTTVIPGSQPPMGGGELVLTVAV
ncbi:hypothetical protein T01_2984 [Trichinella spiralis]|uniref:Uncharacterized protein n=1 Tax=Trichinella spiralis TaxID=6334 RepID=A0A0V0Z3R8_TRISP|nr:hypothetical protein T01_2984 [Trichinella spiralis]